MINKKKEITRRGKMYCKYKTWTFFFLFLSYYSRYISIHMYNEKISLYDCVLSLCDMITTVQLRDIFLFLSIFFYHFR